MSKFNNLMVVRCSPLSPPLSSLPPSLQESSLISIFEPAQFKQAKTYIEGGNALAFHDAIQTMDVNMKDPSDGNTYSSSPLPNSPRSLIPIPGSTTMRLRTNVCRCARTSLLVALVRRSRFSVLPSQIQPPAHPPQFNNAGKTPFQLSVDAVEHGDISYAEIRNFLYLDTKRFMGALGQS